MKNLTDREVKLLKGIMNSNFGNALEGDTLWTFDCVDESGVPEKEAKGVLSSLVKKGLIDIWDANTRDSAITLTDEGIACCLELKNGGH